MKKGDVVIIYEDPVSRKKVEGKAMLLKKLELRSNRAEYWTVKFLSDDFITNRFLFT